MGSLKKEWRHSLTEAEAAEYLGFSKQTLANWRHRRQGPPYVKVGGKAIRYLRADLDAFLDSWRVNPSDDPAVSDTARSVREALEAGEEVAA